MSVRPGHERFEIRSVGEEEGRELRFSLGMTRSTRTSFLRFFLAIETDIQMNNDP